MRILVGIGLALLTLAGFLAALLVRRWWIVRLGGTIRLGLRLFTWVAGRGWAMGLARFRGDDLRWYRIFSLSPRPRRVFSRRGLFVVGRRQPSDRERMVLPENWTIVCCDGDHGAVEIAMPLPTLAGFMSWLEAAPPGMLPTPPTWCARP